MLNEGLRYKLILFSIFACSVNARSETPVTLLCEPAEQNQKYGMHLVAAEIQVYSGEDAEMDVFAYPMDGVRTESKKLTTFNEGSFGILSQRPPETYVGVWQGGSVTANLTYLRTERSGDVLSGTLKLAPSCEFRVTCKMR